MDEQLTNEEELQYLVALMAHEAGPITIRRSLLEEDLSHYQVQIGSDEEDNLVVYLGEAE